MNKTDLFQELIQKKILGLDFDKTPAELYEPMKYAMTMGGKRLRPLLTLLACDMFGSNAEKAIPAALALEVFHNFTLVHDDIMDAAPLRRGKETVFTKWDQNIGILSGDALLAKSFEILLDSDENQVKDLVKLLSKVAIEVCEGQQLDMNFENTEKVTIPEYINMIRLKTAVLTASAVLAGAIVAEANDNDQKEIYAFGENLGIAFQIKDDILDIYADKSKFGKIKGGDILAEKKTFLYITAFESANGKILSELTDCFSKVSLSNEVKVQKVTEIYDQLYVLEKAEAKMDFYYHAALKHLNHIEIPDKNKAEMMAFAESLMAREY